MGLRLLSGLLLLSGLALAGCSGGGATVDVGIHGFAFDPAQVNVASDGRVSFMNHEAAVHTATADDGSFDSGDLSEGEEYTTPTLSAGTHAYHCAKHPSMRGTIVVA